VFEAKIAAFGSAYRGSAEGCDFLIYQAEADNVWKLKYCFNASTNCPYSGGARCRLKPAS
jgi:hypothetical protein